MNERIDVLAVMPDAPSSIATWQVAKRAGISERRALSELRRLEAEGVVILKSTTRVNRSALTRHWWQRAAVARLQGESDA